MLDGVERWASEDCWVGPGAPACACAPTANNSNPTRNNFIQPPANIRNMSTGTAILCRLACFLRRSQNAAQSLSNDDLFARLNSHGNQFDVGRLRPLFPGRVRLALVNRFHQ